MLISEVLTDIAGLTANLGELSDAQLLGVIDDLEKTGRAVDTARSLAAGEVARRSDPGLGYAGLAVRLGHRTPDRLLATLTGSSRSTAARQLRVGAALADESLSVLGNVGIEQADAIARSLGDLPPTPQRAEAIDALVSAASEADAETVSIHARAARQALEQADPIETEAAIRAQRFLRVGREIDGLRRLTGLLDPESAGVVVAALDAATSPRRGGPRFLDHEAREQAAVLTADERSDDQLRLDTLVDLVRVASALGDKPTLGAARPAVRVVIPARELQSQTGQGHIDGVVTPISAATARRLACDSGVLPIVLGTDGEVLDLGRTARVFSPAQRVALAVRDGGCRWPGCDRPPGWCEAHHLVEWSRGGATSLDNGVLLCRHHHMLLHNNGWRAERHEGALALMPPPDIDPAQRPIPLPSKSRAVAALERAG